MVSRNQYESTVVNYLLPTHDIIVRYLVGVLSYIIVVYQWFNMYNQSILIINLVFLWVKIIKLIVLAITYSGSVFT